MKKLVFFIMFALMVGSVGVYAGTDNKTTKEPKTEKVVEKKAPEKKLATTKAPKVQCKFVDDKGKQCKKKTSDPSGFCKKHKK